MANVRLAPLGRALLASAALLAGTARADPPDAYAARRTAETVFRDWRLDCAAGACAIRTAVRGVDGSEVLGLAVSGRGGAAALELRTPLPLLLPDGVALGLGAEPARALAWRTCDPKGCRAQAPLDATLLDALKRERAAEATLTLADGVRVRLLASLLGFTAAWEALAASPEVSPP